MQLFFLGCWNEIKCDKDNRAIILDKILKAGYKIGVLGGDNFYPYKVSKKDLEFTDGNAKLFRKSTMRPLEKLKSNIPELHTVLGNHDLDKLPNSDHPLIVFQYQLELFKDRFYAYPHAGIETYTGINPENYIADYKIGEGCNVKMVFLDFNTIESCKMSSTILDQAKKQVLDEQASAQKPKSWVLIFAHEPLIVYSPNKVKQADKIQYGDDFPIASLYIRPALDDLSRGVGELNEISGGRVLFIAADTHNFQASIVSTPANGNYPLIVCGTGGANPELQLPESRVYPAFDTDFGHHSTQIISAAMPYGYLDIDINEDSITATYINCNDNRIVCKLGDGEFKLVSDNIQHIGNPVESAENCIMPKYDLQFGDKICSKNEEERLTAFKRGNDLDDNYAKRLTNYKSSVYSKSRKNKRISRRISRKTRKSIL